MTASGEPETRLGCESVRLLTGLVSRHPHRQEEEEEGEGLLDSLVIPALRLSAQVFHPVLQFPCFTCRSKSFLVDGKYFLDNYIFLLIVAILFVLN